MNGEESGKEWESQGMYELHRDFIVKAIQRMQALSKIQQTANTSTSRNLSIVWDCKCFLSLSYACSNRKLTANIIMNSTIILHPCNHNRNYSSPLESSRVKDFQFLVPRNSQWLRICFRWGKTLHCRWRHWFKQVVQRELN